MRNRLIGFAIFDLSLAIIVYLIMGDAKLVGIIATCAWTAFLGLEIAVR